MKLALKITGGVLAVGSVAGATAAMIIVNKKDTKNTNPINHHMYNVPGFSKEDMQKRQDFLQKEQDKQKEIDVVHLTKQNAIDAFNNFLTDLGFSSTPTNSSLDMTKFVKALDGAHINHSNPINKYPTSAKILNGSYGPYFLASFGNKYHDMEHLIEEIKKLNKKPTYQELIELFPDTKYKPRMIANRIFKYCLGENPKSWFVPKTSMPVKAPSGTQVVHSAGTLKTTPQDSSANIDALPTSTVNNLKVGVWNVLNYNTAPGETNAATLYKTQALSKIIADAQIDVLGLTEIEGKDSLKALVQELNRISGSDIYKYVRSKESGAFADGTPVGSAGQYEYYGFVYNSTKVRPIEFETTKEVGAIYTNPKLNNELLPGKKTGFVRPAFAIEFEDINKNDFTVAVGHLDSPGGKNEKKGNIEEQSYKEAQGTQEVWEAAHLVDVMNYFDSIDGDNDDLIFLGDTNIKMDQKSGVNTPFQPLIDNGYKALSNPLDSKFLSSLGTAKTDTDYHMANAYDRIFVKSDMLAPNTMQTVYDLLSKTNRDKYFDYSTDADKVTTKYISRTNELTLNGIRYKVSDHSTAYFNLDTSKTDVDHANAQTWDQYLKASRDYKLVPKTASHHTATHHTSTTHTTSTTGHTPVVSAVAGTYDLNSIKAEAAKVKSGVIAKYKSSDFTNKTAELAYFQAWMKLNTKTTDANANYFLTGKYTTFFKHLVVALSNANNWDDVVTSFSSVRTINGYTTHHAIDAVKALRP